MLKCFETSSHLEFNDGSLTFDIDDTQFEGWMDGLEKRLGERGPLNGRNTFKFKVDNLELPKMVNLGGVTASVWHKPKSNGGRSKVMLQGKAFMTFLAFVVPEILKEISEAVPSFLSSALLI